MTAEIQLDDSAEYVAARKCAEGIMELLHRHGFGGPFEFFDTPDDWDDHQESQPQKYQRWLPFLIAHDGVSGRAQMVVEQLRAMQALGENHAG